MEAQTPETPPRSDAKLKTVYWIVAAALTVGVVLDVLRWPVNWLSVAGSAALIAVLVLLATAKPVETRGKKLLIYGLIAVSLGLLLARIAGGGQ
jgi:hypothetical protein